MATSDAIIATDCRSLQPQEVREGEGDLLGLLILLVRRKRLVFGATLGGAAVAILISFLLPSRYTATTRILPPQPVQSSALLLMSQLAGSGLEPLAAAAGKDFGLKNPLDVYVGMLKSRSVADALIMKFDLSRVYRDKKMSDTRKDLAKASDIVASKEGLIEISVEDTNPKRAAEVANSYVEQLRQLTQHLAVTEAGQRRLFFEQQLQEAKQDLAAAELELKDTEQKTGMIQLDAQAKAVIEAVAAMRAQVAGKEVALQAMRSFATEQNPDVVLQERQLAGLRTQLASLESRHAPTGEGDPMVATTKVPAAALQYVGRLREVKYRETIFELMAKQYEAAKLDEAKEAAIIQVVDPAVEPDKRSSPKRALLVSVGLLIAFLSSVFYCIFHEAIRHISRNPREAERIRALRTAMGGRFLWPSHRNACEP